jgi:hypothetical protein
MQYKFTVRQYTHCSWSTTRAWRKKGSIPEEFLKELKTFPVYQGLVWRGTSSSKTTLVNEALLLSTSKNIQTAYAFTKGAIICFYGFKGAYDISSISAFSYEEEVIIISEPHKVEFQFQKEGISVFLSMPLKYWENKILLNEILEGVIEPFLEGPKAFPIINYQVNDYLWVTGPLPTK